jgi:hypothetical protein
MEAFSVVSSLLVENHLTEKRFGLQNFERRAFGRQILGIRHQPFGWQTFFQRTFMLTYNLTGRHLAFEHGTFGL